MPAPQVLEFDRGRRRSSATGAARRPATTGRARRAASPSTRKGNVWIAAAGVDRGSARERTGAPRQPRRRAAQTSRPPQPAVDAHVLKFSREGKFLLQIGKAGQPGAQRQHRPASTGRPASMSIPPPTKSTSPTASPTAASSSSTRRPAPTSGTGARTARSQTRRDTPTVRSDSGAVEQFRTVSCVKIASDGLVYVCDRANDRIQVFKKDGDVRQGRRSSRRRRAAKGRSGTSRSRAIRSSSSSSSPTVRTRRCSSSIARRSKWSASFGDGGRWPGAFFGVGSVARRFEGQRLHGREPRGQARAEVRQCGMPMPMTRNAIC